MNGFFPDKSSNTFGIDFALLPPAVHLLTPDPRPVPSRRRHVIRRITSHLPMHASRLVELAVSAANFHHALAKQHVRAETWRADEFWVLSRARINEWSRLMKECERSKSRRDTPFQPKLFWQSVGPILEEIFLAEVCTRVWCATLTAIDEHRSHGELSPIAQSVFVANLEVRRRALRLLLFSKGLTAVSTLSANLLRRDCEVWTDGLLAQILPLRVAQQFGFDRQRIQRFAQHRDPNTVASSTKAKPVSISSFQLISIQYGLSVREMQDSVCDELNSELAANILSNLPAEGFNGCGEPGLTWATDSFCSDMLSISILEDLCGNSSRPRYDVPGGLLDRR